MPERIKEIDLSRGVMIIFMIFYHVLLNLCNPGFTSPFFAALFGIATSGFPFITGALIGFSKENNKKYPKKVVKAFKIIVLFIILNTINFVRENRTIDITLALDIVFKGSQTITSFEILIPLAYILLLSPLLIKRTYIWMVIGGIILILLDINHISIYNFAGLMAGIFGIGAGQFIRSGFKVNLKQHTLAVVLLIISLVFASQYGFTWSLNILNAFLVLFVGYNLLGRLHGIGESAINLLSKHSLFVYIFHVILLKLISVKFPGILTSNILLILLYSIIYTLFNYCIVLALDFLIQKSEVINKVYKLTFR